MIDQSAVRRESKHGTHGFFGHHVKMDDFEAKAWAMEISSQSKHVV